MVEKGESNSSFRVLTNLLNVKFSTKSKKNAVIPAQVGIQKF